MGATKSLRPITMGPPGTADNEKADEWAKMADEWAKIAARIERGSEQLPYEFSSTSSPT